MEATVAELSKVGYEGLSIDAVAQVAGVNKTTVYRRWPTKEDLVFFSVEHAKADFKCPDTGSVREDLVAFMTTVRDFMITNQGRCFFKLLFERACDPELLKRFRTMRESANDPARVIVARGVQRGDLPPSLDPHLLLLALMGSLKHLVIFEGEPMPREKIEEIVDMVLYGATRFPNSGVRLA